MADEIELNDIKVGITRDGKAIGLILDAAEEQARCLLPIEKLGTFITSLLTCLTYPDLQADLAKSVPETTAVTKTLALPTEKVATSVEIFGAAVAVTFALPAQVELTFQLPPPFAKELAQSLIDSAEGALRRPSNQQRH